MKKIFYGLFSLVVIVTLAIIFLFDDVAKNYAQNYTKNLFKTPIKISQFESSFLNKKLNIDFVEVQNPPSFNNKNAFVLNHFLLEIGDISDDLIVIDAVKLDGLEFVLEQNNTQVNLTTLIENLDKTDASGNKNNSKNSNKIQRRIKIKRLEVDNISLKIDTDWLITTLKVHNISINNFGGNSGIEIDKIGIEVAQEILRNLKKALEKQGIEAGKQKIKETLVRKLGNKLGVDNLQNKFNLGNVGDGFNSIKDISKEKLNKVFEDKLKDKTKDLFKNFGF
jgi:hypothetical protein